METKVSWIHGYDPEVNRRIRPQVLLLGWVVPLCLLDVLCAFYFVLPGVTIWPAWVVGAIGMAIVSVLTFLKLAKAVEKEQVEESQRRAEEHAAALVRMDTRSPEQTAKSAVDQEWAEMQKDNLHLRSLR